MEMSRQKNVPRHSTTAKTEKRRRFLFAAAFLLGAAFLVFGISRGEVAIVLKKAIYICLECIGIG
jgi:hypothetical protein